MLNSKVNVSILESLSKDVFERRTSTGSEVFSLTICLDAKKFVLISFFSLIRTIYLRVSTKPPPNDAKRPLPVDVRRSKTLLLKLTVSLRKPRKQPAFCDAITCFPSHPNPPSPHPPKCLLRNERRNSILIMWHNPHKGMLLIGRFMREICFN